MKLHKCVRGHWELWFYSDSLLDTKVLRPWVILAKARILAQIAVLRLKRSSVRLWVIWAKTKLLVEIAVLKCQIKRIVRIGSFCLTLNGLYCKIEIDLGRYTLQMFCRDKWFNFFRG